MVGFVVVTIFGALVVDAAGVVAVIGDFVVVTLVVVVVVVVEIDVDATVLDVTGGLVVVVCARVVCASVVDGLCVVVKLGVVGAGVV